jgi:alcohol dehydrogenase
VVGVFKIRKRGKLFACVPTTAGTGSEVTIAAVVSDKKNNTKKPCIDTCLVPEYAVLAPELMRKLPAPIVAATGIDALTHAVEAYIGNRNTHYTNQISIDAIDLIFTNLVKAYSEPDNMEAKSNMLEASHLAGLAFTRAGVGWVHAIAHQVGSYYHTPHGLANAIILPTILEFYLPVAGKKMADMARAAGLLKGDESEEEAARAFLDGVKALNKTLNIPEKIEGLLDADIPAIAIAAQKEVYTTPYPVPRYFQSEDELEALILSLQG